MKTIEEQFHEFGVVPVVVLEDAKDALLLAEGAAIALIMATPPACSAGKNFTTFMPLFTACATSEGVMQPGNTTRHRPGTTKECAEMREIWN